MKDEYEGFIKNEEDWGILDERPDLIGQGLVVFLEEENWGV